MIKLKINLNQILFFLISLALGLCYLLALNMKWISLAFILVLIITIFIIMKSKISFFSVFSICILYCLLQSFIKEKTGIAIGILNVTYIKNQFWALCNISFYFLGILFLYLNFSNILIHEKHTYSTMYTYPKSTLILMLTAAIIITVLMFPTIPNFQLDRNNEGILPFKGFEVIPIILMMFTTGNMRQYKWIKYIYFFVSFWYLAHGERVTILGFIIYLFFRYYYSGVKVNLIKIFKYSLLLLLLIFILVWIGLYRQSNEVFTVRQILVRTLLQGTASDVVHTFNCAVDMFQTEPLKHGLTYISYFLEMIPFVQDPFLIADLIKHSYITVGGSLIFNEPLINFGYIGIICFPFVLMWVFSLILRKGETQYGNYVWGIITITLFRLVWYGMTYPIISIVWIIPFCLLIFRNQKNHMVIKNEIPKKSM